MLTGKIGSPVGVALCVVIGAVMMVGKSDAESASGLAVAAVPQDIDAARLVAELGCAACHAGVVATAEIARRNAPPLTNASVYNPAYVYSYLRSPERIRQGIGATRMPSFRLSDRESLALTLYLQELEAGSGAVSTGAGIFGTYFDNKSRDEKRAIERNFRSVRREHDDVTAASGATVFIAFNCAGCHVAGDVRPIVAGPDLSSVNRLQENWLLEYLRAPVAIRPFGFHPGSGARMPDFSLSANETSALVEHLRARGRITVSTFNAIPLSVFSEDKALRLVRDRLPCLGCHRIDGEGGRIGPDLSNVGQRLTASSIYDMLGAPQSVAPGSIMPRHPMTQDRIELIANYLAGRTTEQVDTYGSPLDFVPVRPTTSSSGRDLYARFCSACHGSSGNGDGFNTQYLPVTPTVHADSAYMASRPDDTLFDGVHAGAYILGKSHRMPAFGQRLTSSEIWQLVAYMRELCSCAAPSWSRDGRGM